MKRFSTISIVMPVYNEEAFIEKALLSVIRADTCGLNKEIIVINDGSTDKTSEIILSFTKKYSKGKDFEIKIINKKKNEGKGSAIKDGFMASKGDIVLVQDTDLEYNPEDYPVLLSPFLEHGADVVYGSRFITNKPHRVLYFWHAVGNIFLTLFSNMFTNLNLTDIETGYKVFRGDLIRRIASKLESKRFGIEPELTARIAKIPELKIFEVGISYWGRTYKEGKKIGWKDAVQAIFSIIKYNIFS